MRAATALKGIIRIGIDSSPIIYYVDRQSAFHARCVPFFRAISTDKISAVTSTLTLSETLVIPLRNNDTALTATIRDLVLNADIACVAPTPTIAERAATLRATYRLQTPDAVQIATALETDCDAFLTNDAALKRVVELQIIVVSELTP